MCSRHFVPWERTHFQWQNSLCLKTVSGGNQPRNGCHFVCVRSGDCDAKILGFHVYWNASALLPTEASSQSSVNFNFNFLYSEGLNIWYIAPVIWINFDFIWHLFLVFIQHSAAQIIKSTGTDLSSTGKPRYMRFQWMWVSVNTVTNIYTIPLYVPSKILNGVANYETTNF
jgi:hypothetical protein